MRIDRPRIAVAAFVAALVCAAPCAADPVSDSAARRLNPPAPASAPADGAASEKSADDADLAAANDMLFIIDLQIGHSDWPTEIEAMRALLSQPHVHLAMDPEFDTEPGQAPGDYLGNTKAADINHAIRYLAGLSGELNLPPKLLIIHQFRASMLPDKAAIVDDPRVDAVVIATPNHTHRALLET